MEETCILCLSGEKEPYWDRLRHDVSGRVVRCKGCGLVRLEGASQRDTSDYYVERYAKEYFEGSKEDCEALFNLFYPLQAGKLSRIEKYLSLEHELLEIGSSVGYTLKALEGKVKQVTGIELNRFQARYASEVQGVQTFSVPLADASFEDRSFDHVCMYQVLEHIWDPVRFLKQVYRRLKPGGMLFIEVPTLQNPLVSLYEIPEFKDFWFQQPHLYYFTEGTLSKIIHEAKFQIIEMFPVVEVSFLNHINWMLRRKPMPSRKECMASKLPVDDDAVSEQGLLDEINALFCRFDRQYMKKLEDAGFGDLIFCACRAGDG